MSKKCVVKGCKEKRWKVGMCIGCYYKFIEKHGFKGGARKVKLIKDKK